MRKHLEQIKDYAKAEEIYDEIHNAAKEHFES